MLFRSSYRHVGGQYIYNRANCMCAVSVCGRKGSSEGTHDPWGGILVLRAFAIFSGIDMYRGLAGPPLHVLLTCCSFCSSPLAIGITLLSSRYLPTPRRDPREARKGRFGGAGIRERSQLPLTDRECFAVSCSSLPPSEVHMMQFPDADVWRLVRFTYPGLVGLGYVDAAGPSILGILPSIFALASSRRAASALPRAIFTLSPSSTFNYSRPQ